MNKILNSKCICGEGLIYKVYPLVMVFPCEHMLHKKCHKNKTIREICEICNNKVDDVKTFKQIKELSNKGGIHYQRYIDMVACSNFDHHTEIKDHDIIRLFDGVGLMSMIPFVSNYTDHCSFCKEFLRLLNAKVIINGSENINNTPKVYIVNHTTFIDFPIVNSIFNCGYIASSFIKKSYFGRMIMNMIPLMLIDRGKSGSSTVNKMKKHIKKYGSLCLFPEGMITHPDVIQKFRTGAFYTGYPVQPIVIKYDKTIYDDDVTKFVEKLVTNDNITATVYILPTEYPPFDDIKIEEIRTKMAQVGNLALSRVSNRDIKDT